MARWRRAVELAMTDEDIETLTALSRSRTEPASRVSRAAMLLAYRERPSFFAVGQRLGVHHQTVQRCVERALAYGPLGALDDRPRPGKEPVITPQAKAWLVSMACDKAKEHGYPHELWTLHAAFGPSCARARTGGGSQTVSPIWSKARCARFLSAKRTSSRTRCATIWSVATSTSSQRMAEVLCVYREVQALKKAAAKSKKSTKPVAIVSYDEKPGIQAIATTAPDLPPAARRPSDLYARSSSTNVVARSACWPELICSPERSTLSSETAIAAASSSNSSRPSTPPIRPAPRSN